MKKQQEKIKYAYSAWTKPKVDIIKYLDNLTDIADCIDVIKRQKSFHGKKKVIKILLKELCAQVHYGYLYSIESCEAPRHYDERKKDWTQVVKQSSCRKDYEATKYQQNASV